MAIHEKWNSQINNEYKLAKFGSSTVQNTDKSIIFDFALCSP